MCKTFLFKFAYILYNNYIWYIYIYKISNKMYVSSIIGVQNTKNYKINKWKQLFDS